MSKKLFLQEGPDEGFEVVLGDEVIDEVYADEAEEYAYDSVNPGWCRFCGTREDSCEPDARENHCAHCDRAGVVAFMELLMSFGA